MRRHDQGDKKSPSQKNVTDQMVGKGRALSPFIKLDIRIEEDGYGNVSPKNGSRVKTRKIGCPGRDGNRKLFLDISSYGRVLFVCF